LFLGCVLAIISSVTTTAAQTITPDFGGQIQTTLPSNEQLVGQIQDALPNNDLNTVSDQTGVTIGVAQDLVLQLNRALMVAPDDASRSRIQGVLNHIQAALDSLRQADSDVTLDAARGHLDQARGEALESLNELRPFVLGLVGSGVITGK
jgi:hypothetical protein